MLCRAIRKYGLENFKKEILYVFDTEDEMNSKEAELVTEDFCSRDDTYNICPGGQGGWGYVNRITSSDERSKAGFKGASVVNSRRPPKLQKKPIMVNGKHSPETKAKMSAARSGSKNSQFGSVWITDGISRRRCYSEIPDGWHPSKEFKIEERKRKALEKQEDIDRAEMLRILPLWERYNRGERVRDLALEMGITHPTLLNRFKKFFSYKSKRKSPLCFDGEAHVS